MSSNDGGPALPGKRQSDFDAERNPGDHPGMSLLDWLAGMAMPEIERQRCGEAPYKASAIAKECYDLADAMLAEKHRREAAGGGGEMKIINAPEQIHLCLGDFSVGLPVDEYDFVKECDDVMWSPEKTYPTDLTYVSVDTLQALLERVEANLGDNEDALSMATSTKDMEALSWAEGAVEVGIQYRAWIKEAMK